MASVHDHVRPNDHVFLRLPTDVLRLVEIKPNTVVGIGKLGSFHANLLLGRPYHCTYELLEPSSGESFSRLRVVPPSELTADILAEEANDVAGEAGTPVGDGTPAVNTPIYDPVNESRNNRLTIDDASRQALSHTEIEELKRTAGGREIIERILANHTGLDEKTAFSKAKYMLRKRNKYIKRFTVLPMDLPNLVAQVLEKEPQRIMEIRDETLGLVTAWSNAHVARDDEIYTDSEGRKVSGGRWLVVEDMGGLAVAALAERMSILFPTLAEDAVSPAVNNAGIAPDAQDALADEDETAQAPNAPSFTSHTDFVLPRSTNTITHIHAAVQPNLSLLKYFGYDCSEPNPKHPLHTHLKCLSWLQLLHPDEDPTYREPEHVSEAELKEWKSSKRGNYWRKRRRWQRCKTIVDETREGGFDGLVVASFMDPLEVLQHTVPLLRGGATVVVYSATADSLVRIMDFYSRERRTAYIQHLTRGVTPDPDEFPLDPRLLLAPTLQTSRIRTWQVLPGRTHPLMTDKGGPDGFVFTARKALPLEGGVQARGNFFGKRRKIETAGGSTSNT